MTLGQFRQETADLPDEYILCTTGQFDGQAYEVSSIETWEDEKYLDCEDEAQHGNIIQL